MTAKILQQSGFTLLETMVAIAILLIAVVGPISIMGDSLHKIYFARDQMIAINLAQEGIEAVRQVRDTNLLSGVAQWDDKFKGTFCARGDKQCIVDLTSTGVTSCGGGGCTSIESLVYKNPLDGLYHQYPQPMGAPSGATPTAFHRTIETKADVPGDPFYVEQEVTSTVTWMTGGTPGSVTVTSDVYNWRK